MAGPYARQSFYVPVISLRIVASCSFILRVCVCDAGIIDFDL
ncbi:6576_t:CDS:1, partial [Gigaspora rosea]